MTERTWLRAMNLVTSPEPRLPANEVGAPGEAAAACVEHHEVVVADAAGLERFVECDGNRSGRGVAVMVDVGEDLFRGQSQALGDGVDDAQVGLMRNDK